jgi:predicted AlkP superfamily pyrophosphatase or phosphodiesterase
MKVLLVMVDGMRPDALKDVPLAQKFLKHSAYTLEAQTVVPSVTLPCHVSLFHSVTPARHGTTTNVYAPQVRPIRGLCEVLVSAGKKCAFFYDWEEVRDLSRPNSLEFAYFRRGRSIGYDQTCRILTAEAAKYLTENEVDFTFLYFGYPEAAGHTFGWMSDEYFASLENSWYNIERVINSIGDDYTVIITADHGGHDRTHGTNMPEDMTIPMIMYGKDIKPGEAFEGANIKDIPPTVVKLLGVEPDDEWEGKSLV